MYDYNTVTRIVTIDKDLLRFLNSFTIMLVTVMVDDEQPDVVIYVFRDFDDVEWRFEMDDILLYLDCLDGHYDWEAVASRSAFFKANLAEHLR